MLPIVQICSYGEYQSLCFARKRNIMQRKNVQEEVMEQKEKLQNQIDSKDQPLFTGDYLRDSSVSEYEKAAEVAKAIAGAIEKRRTKKKNEQ